MLTRKTLALLILLCLSASLADSQSFTQIGASLSAGLPSFPSSLDQLERATLPRGVNGFQQATSQALFVSPSIYAHHLVWRSESTSLLLGLRATLFNIDAEYGTNQSVPISRDGVTYQASIAHGLDLTYRTLGIEPYVRVQVYKFIYADIGLAFGLPITTNYSQSVALVDPPEATFIDGGRSYSIDGAMQNFGTAVMPNFRLSASVPLNTRFELQPFVSYSTNIGSIHKDVSIDLNIVQFGIGLAFNGGQMNVDTTDPVIIPEEHGVDTTPIKPLTLIDTTYEYAVDTIFAFSSVVKEATTTLIDETVLDSTVSDSRVSYKIARHYRTQLPTPPPLLRATVKVDFVRPDGQLRPNAELVGTTIRLTRKLPVVPAVVFDSSSSEIPSRYNLLSIGKSASWKESNVAANAATHWQYQILNVIGSRMNKAPRSVVTLHASSIDIATSVKSYLVSRFGIAATRIALDINPWDSQVMDSYGSVLDREVHISSNDKSLFKAISVTSTYTEGKLPSVKLTPEIVSEAGLEQWVMTATVAERPVHIWSDSSGATTSHTWNMSADIEAEVVERVPVVVAITVRDKGGNTASGIPATISTQGAAMVKSNGVPSVKTEVLHINTLACSTVLAESLPADASCVPLTQRSPVTQWYVTGLHNTELHLYRSGEICTLRDTQ